MINRKGKFYEHHIYAITFTVIAVVALCGIIFVSTEADDSKQSTTVINDPPTISFIQYGVSGISDVTSLDIANLGGDPPASGEGTTFTSVVSATVTDSNGCADIDNEATNYSLKIYRKKPLLDQSDGVGCSITTGNDCYVGNTGNLSLGSCIESVSYDITWPVTTYYFLDSTDDGGYTATDWGARLAVTDDDSAVTTAIDSFEVQTLLALDVDSTTDFGTLAVGATSASTEITVKNTGNASEDFMVGNNESMKCSQGEFNSDNVKVTRVRADGVLSAAGMGSRGSESIVNASIPKATTIAESSTVPFFAFLKIPSNVAVRGTCSNTATYTAIEDRDIGI